MLGEQKLFWKILLYKQKKIAKNIILANKLVNCWSQGILFWSPIPAKFNKKFTIPKIKIVIDIIKEQYLAREDGNIFFISYIIF